ncbi:MAG TPA: hypothetical protein VGF33_05385 [Caulobacteraceae bacterium]|jgi:ketosteroid isomerase-like protein
MTKFQLASVAASALMAASLAGCAPPAAKSSVDTGKIADTVKADVAQNVADFNAHDAAKVASHDAPDVVQIFHGTANETGAAADQAASVKFFADNPTTHFSVADGSVDVSASGDLAIYRSSYAMTVTDPKTKKDVTETGNYIAAYKPQTDGSWKLAWSVGSDTPAPAPAAAKN